MSSKGKLTKSDYVDMDEIRRLLRRLRTDKEYIWELYVTFSVASALRVHDVLNIKWSDILDYDDRDRIYVMNRFITFEHKTGKRRIITLSPSTANRILELYKLLRYPDVDKCLFINKRTKEVYSNQHLNRKLKEFKKKYRMTVENFSTHSFRKTFARNYWEKNGKSGAALIILTDVLGHSSMGMTRTYLGITDEETANVYNSLEF